MNNPLKYTDPSGESIIAAILVGAILNSSFQILAGNVNNGKDFFWSLMVGGISGLVGAGVGQFVAGTLSSATTFGGAVANGALIGASGGFAGGFVGGTGNAWIGGASFGQGLQDGLIAGGYGVLGGAIIGSISGGYQYQRQISVFHKGCMNLGVNGGDPVPATDKFLSDAQKAWYKNAPINNTKAFTVENVPESQLTGEFGLITNNASAKTVPLYNKGTKILTGNSNVYFNKHKAFNSAKELFFIMGHEFIHVSQFASLAGQSSSILTQDFISMLEFHAYSYQNSIGGLTFNSFTNEELLLWSTTYSQFNSMNYINFPWSFNHSFVYPF